MKTKIKYYIVPLLVLVLFFSYLGRDLSVEEYVKEKNFDYGQLLFPILKDNNGSIYYGYFDVLGNNLVYTIFNSQKEKILEDNLKLNNVYLKGNHLFIDDKNITKKNGYFKIKDIEISIEDQDKVFWWNKGKNKIGGDPYFDSFFGYDNIVTITLKTNDLNLSGLGLYEVIAGDFSKFHAWENENFIFFDSPEVSGILLEYDKYKDGVIFFKESDRYDIENFTVEHQYNSEGVPEKTKLIVHLKSGKLILNFASIGFYSAYNVVSSFYSSFGFSYPPIEVISEIESGKLELDNTILNISNGYGQLETLRNQKYHLMKEKLT